MASGSGKAKASSWAAAMGVGTVEALKEQHAGLPRWNHTFRNVQPRASNYAAAGNGACGKTKQTVPTVAGGAAARRKAKQEEAEEELRTVMYLSNWGPNN